MNPPRSEGYVRMPDAEFEAILTRAAEEGAKRALADVGLDGDEAALDIRDLRSLVDCIRLVRRSAMQTAVRMISTPVMLALQDSVKSALRLSDSTLLWLRFLAAALDALFQDCSFCQERHRIPKILSQIKQTGGNSTRLSSQQRSAREYSPTGLMRSCSLDRMRTVGSTRSRHASKCWPFFQF
jgi:hypothetical protein